MFIDAGHSITEKWWDHRNVPQAEEHAEELAEQAKRDWRGVDFADALVLLNLEKSEGKSVETGIALAMEIPIIGIGERGSNVFQYLAQFQWVATVSEALCALGRLA